MFTFYIQIKITSIIPDIPVIWEIVLKNIKMAVFFRQNIEDR